MKAILAVLVVALGIVLSASSSFGAATLVASYYVMYPTAVAPINESVVAVDVLDDYVVRVQTGTVFAWTDLTDPLVMTSGDNLVFVGNYGTSNVVVFEFTNAYVRTFPVSDKPCGIGFANHEVLVTTCTNRIDRYSVEGVLLGSITADQAVTALIGVASDGVYYYAVDSPDNAQGAVIKMDASGHVLWRTSESMYHPTALALDASGVVYAANSGYGKVEFYTFAGIHAGTIPSLRYPYGLCVNNNHLFVAENAGNTVSEWQVDASTDVQPADPRADPMLQPSYTLKHSISGWKIETTITKPGAVTALFYDVRGQRVGEITNTFSVGEHTFRWSPSGLSSGIYFLRLTTPDRVFMHKITVLR